MAKGTSKSKAVAQKTIFAAFKILKENDGELPGKEVIDKIRETVEFTDWEKERYEKTGYIRWESILHFYTIDCIKAGYLRKSKGLWILTEEGEKAIKLGEEKLLETASAKYWVWAANHKKEKPEVGPEIEPEGESSQAHKAMLDKYEEEAIEGIRKYILSKNPYEFQDMIAALLESMGYHIPHIAKKGKDGGIDIIAYSDPLGTKDPRIKVQVKHKPGTPVPVEDIRQLIGLLSKPGDVGLFVTSGRFTTESERTARESHKHVELIDFERFVSLWQEYYLKFTDEQKNMLPLQAIYFLGLND